MTFSSASVSACEVDDVVAMAAGGGGGLRGGGKAACWRVAGARAAGALVAAAGAVFLTAVVAAVVVLGAALRAIGRGLGNGTLLGVAQASPANVDNPMASARHVVSAVDRNAAARLDGVTAFLRGESFNRWSLKLYLIEYVGKTLKYAGTLPCLRQHRGKIAAAAFSSEGSGSRQKSPQIRNLEPGKGRTGAGLSPDRQTRYEWRFPVNGKAAKRAFGGSPWQPRRISGDHSPPWSRPSRTARSTRPPSARW
jgi:hypothetical protein